jgi:hypothetical protein
VLLGLAYGFICFDDFVVSVLFPFLFIYLFIYYEHVWHYFIKNLIFLIKINLL